MINIHDWKVNLIDSKHSFTKISDADNSSPTSESSTNDNNQRAKVFQGSFHLDKKDEQVALTIFLNRNVPEADLYLNGKLLKQDKTDLHEIAIATDLLKQGENVLAIVTENADANRTPKHDLVSVQIKQQAGQWKRKLFNGLAQVIIQSTGEPGEIVLKAASNGLKGEVKIPCKPSVQRAEVQ